MALMDELRSEVEQTIAIDTWKTRDGNVVPESKDIGLGNDAVKLNGTVLYADLSDSTGLVQSHKAHFAAEIYKSPLYNSVPFAVLSIMAVFGRSRESA